MMRNPTSDLTAGDMLEIRYRGKGTPIEIGRLECYWCEKTVINTREDKRGDVLPYCQDCHVFYQPTWQLTGVSFSILFSPRGASDTHRVPNEVPQDISPETEPAQPQAPQHKDVREQVLTLLTETVTPLRKQQIDEQIDASPQSVAVALNQLIEQKRIHRIQRGVYQVLTQTMSGESR